MHVGSHRFLGETALFLLGIAEDSIMNRANTTHIHVDLATPAAKRHEIHHYLEQRAERPKALIFAMLHERFDFGAFHTTA